MNVIEIIENIIREKIDTLVFHYEETVECAFLNESDGVFIFKGSLLNKSIYGDSFVEFNNRKLDRVYSLSEVRDYQYYIDTDNGDIYVGSPISGQTITVLVSYWSFTPYNNYSINRIDIERAICSAVVSVKAESGIDIHYTEENGKCNINDSDDNIVHLVAYKTAIILLRQWLFDMVKAGAIVNMTSGRIRVNTTNIPEIVNAITADLNSNYNSILVSLFAGTEREIAGLA